MRPLTILTVLFTFPLLCHSQTESRMTFMGTGADLVDMCRLPDAVAPNDRTFVTNLAMCAAYVEGVVEANMELGKLTVCFSDKMNGVSFAGDVVSYRKQHPDRLGWSAAAFALATVRDTYACPAKPK